MSNIAKLQRIAAIHITGALRSTASDLLNVINPQLYSIFPSIFPIFPALLQPFFPLLPHLERHLLYLVPGPNARTVRYLGESHVIHTFIYKECN